jgi:hypothetical protein
VCIGRHYDVLHDVYAEEIRQDEKWGSQRSHPDGTGPNVPLCYFPKLPDMASIAANARTVTDLRAKRGDVTWLDIFLEEVFEAMEETDPAKLRTELVQAAAVIGQWVEDIDRKQNSGASE